MANRQAQAGGCYRVSFDWVTENEPAPNVEPRFARIEIDLPAVRAYWDAVGEAVRAVAGSVPVEQLSMPVDVARLRRMKDDGTLVDKRAMWLPSFLEGKNKAWFLSMAVFVGGISPVERARESEN